MARGWPLALLALIPGSALLALGSCGGGASSSAAGPIDVQVAFSQYPRLYEPFAVTVTMTAREFDVPGAEAWIELPWGAVYMDGDLTWSGDLAAGELASFSASFAYFEEGDHEIRARLWAPPTGGYLGLGGGGFRPLHVAKEHGGPPLPVVPENQGIMPRVEPGTESVQRALLTPFIEVMTPPEGAGRPAFYVVRDREELEALQAKGVLPAELRFHWRSLFDIPSPSGPGLRPQVDFDRVALLVVRAAADAPLVRRLTVDIDHEARRRGLDRQTVEIRTEFRTVPPQIPVRPRPRLQVYRLARDDTGYGLKEFIFWEGDQVLGRDVHELR